MVKSPVEGHDIVLLKLEQPLVFSGESFLFQLIGEELALPVDQSEGRKELTAILNFTMFEPIADELALPVDQSQGRKQLNGNYCTSCPEPTVH